MDGLEGMKQTWVPKSLEQGLDGYFCYFWRDAFSFFFFFFFFFFGNKLFLFFGMMTWDSTLAYASIVVLLSSLKSTLLGWNNKSQKAIKL